MVTFGSLAASPEAASALIAGKAESNRISLRLVISSMVRQRGLACSAASNGVFETDSVARHNLAGVGQTIDGTDT